VKHPVYKASLLFNSILIPPRLTLDRGRLGKPHFHVSKSRNFKNVFFEIVRLDTKTLAKHGCLTLDCTQLLVNMHMEGLRRLNYGLQNKTKVLHGTTAGNLGETVNIYPDFPLQSKNLTTTRKEKRTAVFNEMME
jgi:hypothetical protein